MENENQKKSTKKKKLSIRSKIILFEFLVIVILILLGLYFRNRIATANKYINEHNIVAREKTKCESLLSQKSGNFDSYQYCKQLLQAFSE